MTRLNIGTVVVRDADDARYRLTATHGRSWVGERLDLFEAPARLTPRTLANFHVEDDDVPIGDAGTAPKAGDEDAGKARLIRENHERARLESPGYHALAAMHEQRLHDMYAAVADEV